MSVEIFFPTENRVLRDAKLFLEDPRRQAYYCCRCHPHFGLYLPTFETFLPQIYTFLEISSTHPSLSALGDSYRGQFHRAFRSQKVFV